VTGSPWKPRGARSVFAPLFLCVLGLGMIAAEASCAGACAGMKTGRELHGDLQIQNGIAAYGCCSAAGICRCGIPERPFSDEPPAGVFSFSTGKGPERYPLASPGTIRFIPQKTYTGPTLEAWVSGVAPPLPLFLFHLALLC